MTPSNVQDTLRKALWTIQKMSGWLGIDHDEVNEDFDNVMNEITEILEESKGDVE